MTSKVQTGTGFSTGTLGPMGNENGMGTANGRRDGMDGPAKHENTKKRKGIKGRNGRKDFSSGAVRIGMARLDDELISQIAGMPSPSMLTHSPGHDNVSRRRRATVKSAAGVPRITVL